MNNILIANTSNFYNDMIRVEYLFTYNDSKFILKNLTIINVI